MMWSKHKLAHNQQREMGDNYTRPKSRVSLLPRDLLHSEKLVSTTKENKE